MSTAIARAVARWTNPETRPLFKGSLIDPATGCMCAQGDVLHNEGGCTADQLERMDQRDADERTMGLLGISRGHSILLRHVNDRSDGQPQNVLTNPASVLGEYTTQVLSLWLHFDGIQPDGWVKVAAADAAAYAASYAAYAYAYSAYAYAYAAADAAYAAAYAAADAADDAAYSAYAADAATAAAAATDAAYGRISRAVRGATMEIIGQAVLADRGKPFVFLPMFGFATPADIPLRYVPPVLNDQPTGIQ